MALTLKHSFQSAKTDGADSTLVQPSNWNANHTLTGANNVLFGTNGSGAGGEITVSTGLSLSSSTLTVAIGTSVQAWDGDLDAIAALVGTSGFLKKTGANTWTLDTSSYQTQIGTTGILKGSGAGVLAQATAGTDYLAPPSGTALLKANSGGALANATAGTDYLAPAAIGVTVQAWDADLDTWATKTAPSGTVVGTSDTQTLSAKTITGLKETKVAVSASDIDLATGNYFTKTISGSTTFTVSNVPASGTVGAFILELTNPGTAVTWWSGVKWVGGTQPTWTGTGVDVLAFYTHDGGTTWRAFAVGKDTK